MAASTSILALAILCLAKVTWAGQVYAHYMVGTLDATTDHAEKDVLDAQSMGFDGFALNVGDPTADFLYNSLNLLFTAAVKHDFKLYISMDVYASGTACYSRNPQCSDVYTCYETGLAGCDGPFDYQWIWDNWKGSSAYATYNGLPIISTFSSGGFHNSTWMEWKEGLANDMYFIPDFDETSGYYDAAVEWWDYWGPVTDGIASWESAWPARAGLGGAHPGDVSVDVPALNAAHARGKTYSMPLSTLQYKNSYEANVYRQGDQVLPARMEAILKMETLPDFIVFVTWNDGPEAHYIGNLWPESNTDPQPAAYANMASWDHSGWQPLVSSFIAAYKAGSAPSAMAPQTTTGDILVGAAWHKTILPDTITCNSGDGTLYYEKPDGFLNGTNNVYWSIVLDSSAGDGYQLSVYTNQGNDVAATFQLSPGLNYGDGNVATTYGAQRLVVTDSTGSVVYSATSSLCVSVECPSAIYNSNYQVLAFVSGDQDTGCVAWPTEDVTGHACITGDSCAKSRTTGFKFDMIPTCYTGSSSHYATTQECQTVIDQAFTDGSAYRTSISKTGCTEIVGSGSCSLYLCLSTSSSAVMGYDMAATLAQIIHAQCKGSAETADRNTAGYLRVTGYDINYPNAAAYVMLGKSGTSLTSRDVNMNFLSSPSEMVQEKAQVESKHIGRFPQRRSPAATVKEDRAISVEKVVSIEDSTPTPTTDFFDAIVTPAPFQEFAPQLKKRVWVTATTLSGTGTTVTLLPDSSYQETGANRSEAEERLVIDRALDQWNDPNQATDRSIFYAVQEPAIFFPGLGPQTEYAYEIIYAALNNHNIGNVDSGAREELLDAAMNLRATFGQPAFFDMEVRQYGTRVGRLYIGMIESYNKDVDLVLTNNEKCLSSLANNKDRFGCKVGKIEHRKILANLIVLLGSSGVGAILVGFVLMLAKIIPADEKKLDELSYD